MAEFRMDGGVTSLKVTEDVKRTAHERVIKVLGSVYEHNQVDFDVLTQAQMHVYACERVVAWLLTGESYWESVTHAVTDVLYKYPLQGYPLKQGGEV